MQSSVHALFALVLLAGPPVAPSEAELRGFVEKALALEGGCKVDEYIALLDPQFEGELRTEEETVALDREKLRREAKADPCTPSKSTAKIREIRAAEGVVAYRETVKGTAFDVEVTIRLRDGALRIRKMSIVPDPEPR